MESTTDKTNQSQASVMIECPAERVFSALTDIASHVEWARGPEEIRAVSENPARLGTTWQQVSKILGKTLVAECRVNIYEENRALGFTGDKPFPFQFKWVLEPVVGGTSLTMSSQAEPGGFFRIAGPVLSNALDSRMKSDLLTLKARLETEA